MYTLNLSGEVLIPDPAPELTEVTPVSTPTMDFTPNYTFHSTEAGVITYEGVCTSDTTNAIEGNNTITFNSLSIGTYDSCFITVTDEDGNVSEALAISPFVIDQPVPVNTTWEKIIEDLTVWQAQHINDLPEHARIKQLEKEIAQYHKFVDKNKSKQSALFARKAIQDGYSDIEGIIQELITLFPEDHAEMKSTLIQVVWEEWGWITE